MQKVLPAFLQNMEGNMSEKAPLKRKFTYHAPLTEFHSQATTSTHADGLPLGERKIDISVTLTLAEVARFLVLYNEEIVNKRPRLDENRDTPLVAPNVNEKEAELEDEALLAMDSS